MGDEAIRVVQGMWDAFNRGDGRASIEAFHPDVEWDGRNFPDGVLGRGRQVVIDHVRTWASIWKDWTVEIEELTQVTPETVIAYTRERGRSDAGSTWTSGTPRRTSFGTARSSVAWASPTPPRRFPPSSRRRGRPPDVSADHLETLRAGLSRAGHVTWEPYH